MKIKYLQVSEYLQFNDFELDLTYPKGHHKAGQPLDKVCFIGQSGTGKTLLLNLIKTIVSYNFVHQDYITPEMEDIWAEMLDTDDETHRKFGIEGGEIWSITKRKAKIGFITLTGGALKTFLRKYYQNTNILFSFPAEMNRDILSVFSANTKKKVVLPQNLKNPEVIEELSSKIFDFELDNIESIWNLILDDIQKYKVAQLSYHKELSNRLNDGAIELEAFEKDFQAWKANNAHPLKELADKLNPMLNRFNLEIQPEFDVKTADDLRFIQIHQKGGSTVLPHDSWSTGTKQLIMTAIPLLKLNTDKAVILIDEPEYSFYPDIQRDLMGFYRHLAPKAQFFIATHSPIIAASFDPWEIVGLEFNEEGNIVQKQYFEGERHVDNYRIHPKYLRWDSILIRLFDLKQEGMPEREAKLKELAELDIRLQKMTKANDSVNKEEVKALWEKFKQTAELLDWKIKDYQEN